MPRARYLGPRTVPTKYLGFFKAMSKAHLCDLVWQCLTLDVEPPYDAEDIFRELVRWDLLTRQIVERLAISRITGGTNDEHDPTIIGEVDGSE